jgi:hydrogenase maturation protease
MPKHTARSANRRRKSSGSPHAAAHDSVLVIGLGNPLRGDDAAGRIVAARLKRKNRRFLRVAEALGEGADLLELWAGSGKVIVVDAVDSGGKTGMIHRFDANRQALPVRFGGSSTHAIGLGEAVELARALNQLPSRLIVYGIEGRQFDMGSKPSAEVKRMVPRVVDRVVGEARTLLAAQAPVCGV